MDTVSKTAIFLFAVVCPLCVPNISSAQTIAEQLTSGRLDLLRSQASDPQASALVNTVIGRSDLNASIPELQHAVVTVPYEGQRTVSASRWLLEVTRNSRVVMFNENHYEPQARVFVRSLLRELRRAGFTHIGFEAFQPTSVPNAYQSLPGYYTVEPTFAALMAEATSLGFVVFGYEATQFADQSAPMEEIIAAREKSEAENLKTAVDSFPQSARVVIFAGWSHIAEKPLDDGLGRSKTRWMAARFLEETNIDPFTVDLTTCTREVADSEDRDGVVYLQADSSPLVNGSYQGVVDAQVCLPVAAKTYPDPASFFRRTLGKRVHIPSTLMHSSDETLVQAYKDGFAQNRVAHDRVLVRPGEHMALYLPPGSYELVSTLSDGTLVARKWVRVSGTH
jgi:hypothetical protein